MIDHNHVSLALQRSDVYHQFLEDVAAGKRPRAHVVHGFLLPTNMTLIGAEPYVVYDKQQFERTYPHRGERIIGKHPALGAPYGRNPYDDIETLQRSRDLLERRLVEMGERITALSIENHDLRITAKEAEDEAAVQRRARSAAHQQIGELKAKLETCEQVNLQLQRLIAQYRDEALIHPRTAALINQAIAQLQRALRGE